MAVQGEDCDRPTTWYHPSSYAGASVPDPLGDPSLCGCQRGSGITPSHVKGATSKVNTIHVAVSVLNFCFVAPRVSTGSCGWCSAMTNFSIRLQSIWSAGIVELRLLPLMKGQGLFICSLYEDDVLFIQDAGPDE